MTMFSNTRLFFSFFILLLAGTVIAQQDYSCSASKPCKLGCCGKNNVCGLGPSYCAAANCTSSCGAKSECDPGWGAQWSSRSNCPLNVCCSKYGFCGTTTEFCGDKKPPIPSCPGGTSANQKIIGYYEGWSTSKACNGLNPENMLSGAYTHLNYAFAFIDPTTYKIANMQDSDTKYMPRLTNLKNYNPGLQVWIAIGGWSMNDPDQPTKRTFSELAASKSKQDVFFASLLSFMDKYGFDGVDIDWEYPVAEERSGVAADFKNYVTFLKNLRAALGAKGLSITLPASYWYLQNFDIKNMEPIVDWFNVMTYDLHGTWDGTNPYLGPYINAHTNLTEIDLALQLLWRNNINPKKVVMGVGFYGRSFTLSNPSCKSAGCGFTAGGNPGRCSASAGTLMFNEIQEIIAAGGATVTTDTKAAVKIVTYGGDQWVSYDDASTLKTKMDYANGKCLGGVMVWAASTDDNKGTAIQALAKAAGKTSFATSLAARQNTDPSQCTWGECGQKCPAGLVPVESSGSNASPLGIELGCTQGKRNFCCPAKDPPTCNWKGSPKFCGLIAKNKCGDSEIEIAASTDGCWTGHKSLCCSKKDSTSTIGACKWEGAAPFCSAGALFSSALGPAGGLLSFQGYGCPNSDRPLEQTKSKQGEGGQQSCSYNGGFKSFCCPKPSPWNKCKWRQGSTSFVQWEYLFTGPLGLLFDFQTDCKTGCEAGETTVATDSWGCRSGTYNFYCCGNPNQPAPPILPETNLCPGPASLPGRSSQPESSNSPKNILEEGRNFEDTCTFPGTSMRRDLSGVYGNNETLSEESLDYPLMPTEWSPLLERSLVKRGLRDRAMKLCGPQQRSASIYVQNYPGATSIFRTTGKAYTVAKVGVCAVVGITGLTTLDPNVDWVAEHVFEKQEFRDALEHMTAGTTPSGQALTAGAAPFSIFDKGIFQDNWPSSTFPSLTTVRGWAGNINDAFTGLLGRTTDQGLSNANMVNLQVCDADFNTYKEYVVAKTDFMSAANWGKYDPLDRIGILTDFLDTFSYRSADPVIASFQKTYSAMATLWGDFARYAVSKGITYDFVSAWKQIVPDNLSVQVTNARTVFTKYLDGEITFWASSAAKNLYSPSVIKDMATRLAGFKTNLNTLVALPINKMTA